jgi:protease IV
MRAIDAASFHFDMSRHCLHLLVLLALLCTVAGCSWPSLLITPVAQLDSLEEIVVQTPPQASRDKVLVIPVDGTIANARVGGMLPLTPTENMVALVSQQLERAERDSSIRAVVLRINSPGGTVTGSDTLYELVMRFRAKSGKPVVSSCQEVCASGGYYLACASDAIVAQPTSLVGSIGVIFHTVSVQQLMSRWGIVATTIKSGTMKDIGSPFHDPTDAEKAIMQQMIDEYFARFKGIVAARRALKDDRLARVTDGRVFSGATAKELGLVDQLGTLEDAIDLARTRANSPHARAVMLRRPYGPGGSIYASSDAPQPRTDAGQTLNVNLSVSDVALPTGFYFLWRP